MLGLFPVLFHRVGLIILLISASILLILPRIYIRDDDLQFAHRLSRILISTSRLGLILLILTGLIRLTLVIPSYFIFKALSAGITTYWTFVKLSEYPSETYQQTHIVHLILICLTAVIGILL